MSADLATMMHRTDAALAELGFSGVVKALPDSERAPHLRFGVDEVVPAQAAWRAFQVAGIESYCFRCFLWGHEHDSYETGCLEVGRWFLQDCGIERDES